MAATRVAALLDARTRQLARRRAQLDDRSTGRRRVVVLSGAADTAEAGAALYALPDAVCGAVLELRVTPLPAMQRVPGLCGLAVHDGGIYSVGWLPALLDGAPVSESGPPTEGHMLLMRGLGRAIALAAPRILAVREAEEVHAPGAASGPGWCGAAVEAHLRLDDGALVALLDPRRLLAPLLPSPAGHAIPTSGA